MSNGVQKEVIREPCRASSIEDAQLLAEKARIGGRGEFPARIKPEGLSVRELVAENTADFLEIVGYALGMSPDGEVLITWPE